MIERHKQNLRTHKYVFAVHGRVCQQAESGKPWGELPPLALLEYHGQQSLLLQLLLISPSIFFYVSVSQGIYLLNTSNYECGPGGSVGIATNYGLDGPGSNPGGEEIFPPSRSALGPNQPPGTMGTGSFPGVKCSRGVLLTTHPLLVPRSWKSRAIPLPTLWATPVL